ncbi:MAG: trypsin-like peptidase domain-containing protein [Bdellovibrionales bacterium]
MSGAPNLALAQIGNPTSIFRYSALRIGESLGEKTPNCTGFFITPRSHFLTALHCFNGVIDSKEQLPEHVQIFLRDQKRSVRARILRSGYPLIERVQIHKGFFESSDQERETQTREILSRSEKRTLQAPDWILLQLEDTRTSSCLQISNTPPRAQEELVALGFPALESYQFAKRTGRTQPEGLRVCHARLFNSSAFSSGLSGKISPQAKRAYNEYMKFGVLPTDINFAGAMSGGPVLQMSGAVAGIISNSSMPCPRVYEAVDLQAVLPSLDPSLLNANKSCRRLETL